MYWSQDPLNYLIGWMLTICDGKLLKYAQRTNHTSANPRGVSSLPVEFDSHVFSKITQLSVNPVLHSRNHWAASTKNHVFHQCSSQIFIAFLQGSFQHVRQCWRNLFMNVSRLPRNLRKENLSRTEDGLFWKLHYVSIWKLIAFFLQGSLVT